MNCTLNICGDKKIQNPKESDIRQAVFALDTKKGDAFLVLGRTDITYIQTRGDQKVGFDLEYQETDTKHHYRAKRDFTFTADEIVKVLRGFFRLRGQRAKRDFTADEIVKALVSYSTGADNWKKAAEWEIIK